MFLQSQQIGIGLLIASAPAILSIYFFLVLKKEQLALLSLLLSAFILRLLIISLDPYLQDWDERFHALVAKNMILHPFIPMLRIDPIMDYDPKAWCCNHIWLHKQPLFLWQIAASMKLFGVNIFALRLPSAILGTISVFFTYEIAKFWTRNTLVAFLAALLLTFSFYQLELTSGRLKLDHNDLAFMFYITGSIWAFVRYLKSRYTFKWAILIGIFVGCAILIKWLTAFLIFGGWGLYLLQKHYLHHKSQSTATPTRRFQMTQYGHLLMSFLISCIIFLPWQIYIQKLFPVESAISYAHNRQHFIEVFGGHDGGFLFHFDKLSNIYGGLFIPFLIVGLVTLIRNKEIDRVLSKSFYAMIIVVYAFFSLFVATKMISFPFPVSSLLFILIAYGLVAAYQFIAARYIKPAQNNRVLYLSAFIFAICLYALKPWDMIKHRSPQNTERAINIHNAQVYRSLDDSLYQNVVVLNCKSFEDVELMFYKNVNAYHWFPKERVLDSLQHLGYRFAAFQSHTNQGLPQYILRDEDILIIDKTLR